MKGQPTPASLCGWILRCEQLQLLLQREAVITGQKYSGAQSRKWGHCHQSKRTNHRMQQFRRDIFVIEDIGQRRSLGHEHHQQSYIPAGVCQQQCGCHRSHSGPAHIQTGSNCLFAAECWLFLNDLIDSGGNIHGQVHNSP